MMIGVKGKQLCTGNPNADDRRTDRTDMMIPVYPPNFVAGGINTALHIGGTESRTDKTDGQTFQVLEAPGTFFWPGGGGGGG